MKLINFLKSKYRVLIPAVVVLVLLIALFFLYREYKYDNYRNKKEVSVYQYFGGVRTDYTAIFVYNLKNKLIDVTPKDTKIDYDSTPIYYKDGNKAVFLEEMTVAFPLKTAQYKTYKYSSYEELNKVITITNNREDVIVTNCFLYDGNGLYFFPEAVTISIDGVKYKEIGAMSYINVRGGYTMSYYDKENDTAEVVDIEKKKVTVSSEHINVNLTDEYFTIFDEEYLLFKPALLDALSN